MVRRLRNTFHDRRTLMDKALSDYGLTVAGAGAFGGSSYWMRAPNGIDTTELAARLRQKSVLIEAGAAFCEAERREYKHYRLAYSSISATQIAPGVALIAKEIELMRS